MKKRQLDDKVRRIINPITRRLPDDNAYARNAELPLINRAAKRRLGTDLLTQSVLRCPRRERTNRRLVPLERFELPTTCL